MTAGGVVYQSVDAVILDLVGAVAMLVGVEAVGGAGNIENRRTHVQFIIIDKSANSCSAGFGIDLAIRFDGHDDIGIILIVVASEFSDHPTWHIRAVASAIVVVILVFIMLVRFIGKRTEYGDAGDCADCFAHVGTATVLLIIFDRELCRTAIIHPDAVTIIIPVFPLTAFDLGNLASKAYMAWTIQPARVVVIVVALAGNLRISNCCNTEHGS